MNTDQKSTGWFHLTPGIWLVIGVMVLFGAHYAWGWAHYPHQMKRLARELSSINIIQKVPVVNHARTLVGVIHTTDQGVGVFIENIKTKEEKKLIEVSDVNYAPSGAWTFGWSPDDKTFAYALTNLFFWNGVGNKLIGQVAVANGIEPFAWLSSTACAYIDRDPKLVLVQYVDGSWNQTGSWPLPDTNGKPRSLVAMGSNTVAWQTDNTLWQLDVFTGAIKPLCSTTPKTIESISFSKDDAKFLIVENTNHSTTSILVTLSMESNNEEPVELERKSSIIDAQWINQGKGYACVRTREGKNVLTVKTSSSASEQDSFVAGNVWSIFCDGSDDNIFALASKTSEPAGIWQCGAKAEEDICVVSPWGSQGSDFHFQPALVGSARYYLDGKSHYAKFTLVPPVNFSREKKYPLVIGTASYEWSPIPHGVYAQCLANCGAYVALVNYHWDLSNPETVLAYTNNIIAVYNQLVAGGNINTDQVYIFGFSAGTAVIRELVKQYPDRFSGLMLHNPTALPEPQAGMTRRILVTAGSGEEEVRRFQRYQKELLSFGIPMEWYIHANSQHVVRAKEAMYERAILMGNMIFKK